MPFNQGEIPIKPPCINTHNRAFTAPEHASAQAIAAAIKICGWCPIRLECAKEALTSGTELLGRERPASGVIVAGIVAKGNEETARQLADIAGVEYVELKKFAFHRRKAHGEECLGCGATLHKWTREPESIPPGWKMHHGRGYCVECRTAYSREQERAQKREQDSLYRWLKPIDRKRHHSVTAEARRRTRLRKQQAAN